MSQYTDIAADFEKSDTSTNMFEMEKPPADPLRTAGVDFLLSSPPRRTTDYATVLFPLPGMSNDLEVVRLL